MRALPLLLVLGLVACDDPTPPAPSPAPAPSTPVPSAATEPARPSAGPRSPGPGRAAADAYRALVTAYGRRERDAYFTAFADPLDCFYGRADVPRARVEAERWPEGGPRGFLAVAKLSLLEEREDRVTLLDRGFWLEDAGGRQVIHEKIVILERRDGAWRVVAETNRDGAACLEGELGLPAHASETFAGCRGAHRGCLRACGDGACRDGCMQRALVCLGVRGAAPPTSRPAALESAADVRRFVTVSIRHQLQPWGGRVGDAEEAAADAEWLRGISARVGAPRIRAGSAGGEARCGYGLLSRDVGQEAVRVEVGEVRCTNDRARCVAALELETYGEPAAHRALHLLFEGEALRVALLDGPTTEPPDLTGALDRWAAARPPVWDVACRPTVEALADDRVGEDFWRLESRLDEGDAVRVGRSCGAAAARAVRELGDDWDCAEPGRCAPPFMCGNYCEILGFDEGRVLSHSVGIDPPSPLRPDALAALRRLVPCASTVTVPAEALGGELE